MVEVNNLPNSEILWTAEFAMNLYQNDTKRKVFRKGTAHDLQNGRPINVSVKHSGASAMSKACMAARGTGLLVLLIL